MKKIYSLFLLALVAPAMSGRHLTPAEALQRVNADASTTLSAIPKHVSASSPALEVRANAMAPASVYVFDTAPGYMVVSADDCAAPLLGYSASGSVNDINISPNLRYWLDFYARQIAWASANGVNYTKSKTSRATDMDAIAPLVKTTWNQSAPYNDKCPEFSGERSVTGCVATAMAQVMYYNQWPAQAQGGTLTYTSDYSSEYEKSMSLNFDDVTFNWSDMLTNYTTDNYTTAQGDAVAELMYAAGISVQMDYSPVESASQSVLIAPALYKYFNYDASVQMPQRAYYTESDWEQLIYAQLAEQRPVLYDGQSTQGGHQFVCDGYQGDGYFHFNWGWSGMSDGYYLLSALDPEAQGTGGSTSGFNFDQGICINIGKPGAISGATDVLMYCSGDFLTEGLQNNEEDGSMTQTVDLGSSITFSPYGGIDNYSSREVSGTPGVKLTDASGNSQYVYSTTTVDVPIVGNVMAGTTNGVTSYSVTLPQTLSQGSYTMTPVFLVTGASEPVDMICPISGVQSLIVEVSGSSATIEVGNAPSVTVSSSEFKSQVYLDSYFSLQFTLSNTGQDQYYGLLMAMLTQDGEEVTYTEEMAPVTVDANSQGTFNLIGMFSSEYSEFGIEPGTYNVSLVDYSTGNVLTMANNLTVNLQSALETEPTLTLASFTLEGSNQIEDPSAVTFKGTVECESGYFAGQLNLVIFPSSGGDDIYSSYTDYMFLGEGETSDFSQTVNLSSVVSDNNTYFAMIYNGSSAVADNQVPFTVTTSGITGIEAQQPELNVYPVPAHDVITIVAPQTIESVTVVDLAGRNVETATGKGASQVSMNIENVAPGHYFIVVKGVDGTTASRHIIKN